MSHFKEASTTQSHDAEFSIKLTRRLNILNVIKTSILNVFPDWVEKDITESNALASLGADSIDRAEILMLTMRQLKSKLPLIAFAQAKNIYDLIDIFYDESVINEPLT